MSALKRVMDNYTLKGTLTGLFIYLGYFIFSLIYENLTCKGETACGFSTALIAFFGVILIPIGAIIGWVYGKIKGNK